MIKFTGLFGSSNRIRRKIFFFREAARCCDIFDTPCTSCAEAGATQRHLQSLSLLTAYKTILCKGQRPVRKHAIFSVPDKYIIKLCNSSYNLQGFVFLNEF